MLRDSVRAAAVGILADAQASGDTVADRLERSMARLDLAPRDRGRLTRLVFETTRRRATLDAVVAAYSGRPVADLTAGLKAALRVAAFSLLHDRNVAPWAIVNDAVEAAKRHDSPGAARMANAVLRKMAAGCKRMESGGGASRRRVYPLDDGVVVFDRKVFPSPANRPLHLEAVRSHPSWLIQRWAAIFGNRATERLLTENNRAPSIWFRVADPDRPAPVGGTPGRFPDMRRLTASAVADLPGLGSGEVAVQDQTASGPARALLESSTVLDLCAAPGGKTAQLLDGGVTVIAADIDRSRLSSLFGAPGRAGGRKPIVLVADAGRPPFDGGALPGVLLDAPCSNTGVLRRRAEARWRLTPAGIADRAALQRKWLNRALDLVMPGGRLVYATCSIEPSENQDVVAAVLGNRPDWVCRHEEWVLPGESDGGFWAVLERLTGQQGSSTIAQRNPGKNPPF